MKLTSSRRVSVCDTNAMPTKAPSYMYLMGLVLP
jgi:hypothetical protein